MYKIINKILLYFVRLFIPLFAKEYVLENESRKQVVSIDKTVLTTYDDSSKLQAEKRDSAENRFYIRRKNKFISKASKRNISTIEGERFDIRGADISFPYYVFKGNALADGSVYADNFSMKFEYPQKDNSMDGKYLRLNHFSVKELSKGNTYSSKSAVIGASLKQPLQRSI